MIRTVEAAEYPVLIKIWESAVLHTHDFLRQEDFYYYREQLPLYFGQVTLLGYESGGSLTAFMGIAGPSLEMLFAHNDHRGRGIGKQLLVHAMEQLQVTRVDVNEQNRQAVAFYQHMGFHVVKRSPLDGQGKAYPLLHMSL